MYHVHLCPFTCVFMLSSILRAYFIYMLKRTLLETYLSPSIVQVIQVAAMERERAKERRKQRRPPHPAAARVSLTLVGPVGPTSRIDRSDQDGPVPFFQSARAFFLAQSDRSARPV